MVQAPGYKTGTNERKNIMYEQVKITYQKNDHCIRTNTWHFELTIVNNLWCANFSSVQTNTRFVVIELQHWLDDIATQRTKFLSVKL